MPIRTAIWKVAAQPEPFAESSLAKEQLLEAMIVAAPRLLSDEWMLIGRQEDTEFGGHVDLVSIAPGVREVKRPPAYCGCPRPFRFVVLHSTVVDTRALTLNP
jgi:hypothetical protein